MDVYAALKLAAKGELPASTDDSQLPAHIVAELIEAGYMTAIDVSTLDGQAFADPKITFAGREYLRKRSMLPSKLHQRPAPAPVVETPAEIQTSGQRLKVFISHSSVDVEAAASIVNLLKISTNLRSHEIRCTSVPGYQLEPGAETDSQLKKEVFECDVFVALLSKASLRSTYVTFEMGARWGSRKPLIPVLISGTPVGSLQAPLSGLHAISMSSQADIHSLIEKIRTTTGAFVEPIAVFANTLSAIASASAKPPDEPLQVRAVQNPSPFGYVVLAENEHRVVWNLAMQYAKGNNRLLQSSIMSLTALDPLRLSIALSALSAKDLILSSQSPTSGPMWKLTSQGVIVGDLVYTMSEKSANDSWLQWAKVVNTA